MLDQSLKLTRSQCNNECQMVLLQSYKQIQNKHCNALKEKVLISLGTFYKRQGNYRKAIQFYSELLAFIGDSHELEIHVLNQLRCLFVQEGHITKAIRASSRITRILKQNSKSTENTKKTVQSLINTSILYEKINKFNISKKLQKESYQLALTLPQERHLLDQINGLLISKQGTNRDKVAVKYANSTEIKKVRYEKRSKAKINEVASVYSPSHRSKSLCTQTKIYKVEKRSNWNEAKNTFTKRKVRVCYKQRQQQQSLLELKQQNEEQKSKIIQYNGLQQSKILQPYIKTFAAFSQYEVIKQEYKQIKGQTKLQQYLQLHRNQHETKFNEDSAFEKIRMWVRLWKVRSFFKMKLRMKLKLLFCQVVCKNGRKFIACGIQYFMTKVTILYLQSFDHKDRKQRIFYRKEVKQNNWHPSFHTQLTYLPDQHIIVQNKFYQSSIQQIRKIQKLVRKKQQTKTRELLPAKNKYRIVREELCEMDGLKYLISLQVAGRQGIIGVQCIMKKDCRIFKHLSNLQLREFITKSSLKNSIQFDRTLSYLNINNSGHKIQVEEVLHEKGQQQQNYGRRKNNQPSVAFSHKQNDEKMIQQATQTENNQRFKYQ